MVEGFGLESPSLICVGLLEMVDKIVCGGFAASGIDGDMFFANGGLLY
jgi:hypothetical protein